MFGEADRVGRSLDRSEFLGDRAFALEIEVAIRLQAKIEQTRDERVKTIAPHARSAAFEGGEIPAARRTYEIALASRVDSNRSRRPSRRLNRHPGGFSLL